MTLQAGLYEMYILKHIKTNNYSIYWPKFYLISGLLFFPTVRINVLIFDMFVGYTGVNPFQRCLNLYLTFFTSISLGLKGV